MAAAKNREKNQEMAARLKKAGDKRDVGRCPICSKVVALAQLQVHIAHHPC